ncbi:MAG: tetratricopeptide repeat protein [Deltaproteobacteria bacterium]|nr:tetratricopeptide repeat protein [Deltaproteobacteria bacterium]
MSVTFQPMDARQPENDVRPLELEVQDGAGFPRLVLATRALAGGPWIENLELAVPCPNALASAFANPKRLQRRRLRVLGARLVLDDRSIESLLWSRADRLAAAGFDEVRVRILEGILEISGRARVDDRAADVTGRAWLEPGPDGLRVVLLDAHALAFTNRPTPLVMHDLVLALLDLPARAGAERPSRPPPGQASKVAVQPPFVPAACEPLSFARILGLGDFAVQPLEMVLWRLFPPLGWRLPDASFVRIASVHVSRGRIEVSYSADAAAEPATASRPPRVALTLRAAEMHHGIDQKILAGDLDGALASCRTELSRRGHEDPLLIERVLGLLSSREASFREAEELAREVLGRWPDYAPAHAVLAVIALERGRVLDAASYFSRLLEIAEASGNDEEAVRAALTTARCLRDVEPGRSTPFYERVLDRRPTHGEAAEMLAERYAAEERWPEVIRLARRRIAHASDPREQAREHLRLGDIFLNRLGEPDRALEELEAASHLSPGDGRAWDLLGRALAAVGNTANAIEALGRLAELQASKGDAVGEGKTHAFMGGLWEREAELDSARACYERALAILPEDPDVLGKLATLAARAGSLEDAATYTLRLADVLPESGPAWARAERDLGRLRLQLGDVEAAKRHLLRAVSVESPDPETLVVLAEVEERSDRLAEAAELYGRAAALMVVAPRAAELELCRARLLKLCSARLCEAQGLSGDMMSALELAFELSPESRAGQEAARALAILARDRGDVASEAGWLDALLAVARGAPDAGELTLRRAELFFAAGEPERVHALVEHALRCGADRRRARMLLANAMGALDDLEGRAALLEEIAAETTDTAESARLHVQAAEARLGMGDRDGAVTAARRAFDLLPNDDVVRRMLGQAAWQARSWVDVIDAYQRLSVEPAFQAEQARRLGVALECTGREEEALEAYRQAFDAPEASGEPLSMAWRRTAELLERQGEFSQAVEILRQAAEDTRTADSPATRAELHHLAAELLRWRLSSAERAIEECEAALRLDPEHMPALDALEAMHAEAGDFERVAAILGRKVRLSGRHPERQKAVLLRLAEVQFERLGRTDAAREALKRALELDSDYRPALRFLVRDALDVGDRVAARSYFERLASPGDDWAEETDSVIGERVHALRMLATLAREDGRGDDVEKYLSAALDLLHDHPGRETILSDLAKEYEATSHWLELASLLAQQALRTTDPAVRVALEEKRIQVLLSEARDPERALGACRHALADLQGEPRLLSLLAACAEAAGDEFEQAHALLRLAALETDVGSQRQGLLRAAEILTRLGEIARAREIYEGLRAQDPEDSWIAERLASLGDGAAPGTADEAGSLPPSESPPVDALDDVLSGREERRLVNEAAGTLARALAELASERQVASPDARVPEDPGIVERLVSELRATAWEAGRLDALASGLMSAASVEPDPGVATAWLSEAAKIQRTQLGDPGAAVESLCRALSLRPGDGTLVSELEELLGEQGDFARLLSVYEVHLEASRGRERAPILHRIGRTWADAFGEPARAATYFAYAHSADPGFAPALVPLADFHFSENELGPAEDYYQRALAQAGLAAEDRVSVLVKLGEVGLKQGDPPRAAERFREALSLDPSSDAALSWLEHALRLSGDWQGLVEILLAKADKLSDLEEQATCLHEAAALLEGPLSRGSEAGEIYARILERDPSDALARARLDAVIPDFTAHVEPADATPARSADELVDSDAREASTRFAHALDDAAARESLRSEGRWAELVALLESDAEQNPSEAPLLLLEAGLMAASRLGKSEQGLSLLNRALAAAPAQGDTRARIFAERADLHAQLGNVDEAKADLSAVLAHGSPPGLAFLVRARLRLAEGYPDAAILQLQAAIEDGDLQAHKVAEAHWLSGQAHDALGDPERAAQAYAQASELEPLDPRPVEALVAHARAKQDHELLAELLGRQILISRDRGERARLWFERAVIYRDELGRGAEAYRCLKESFANDPEAAHVVRALRSMAVTRGEWALTAELLYREIDATSDSVERATLHVELATIYEERLLDLEAALRNYETARALHPGLPEPMMGQARLYGVMQRYHDAARAEEAAAAFERGAGRAERLLRASEHRERVGQLEDAQRLLESAAQVEGGGEPAELARSALRRIAELSVTPAERQAALEERLRGTEDQAERLDLLRQLLDVAVQLHDDDEIDVRAREVLTRDPSDLAAFVERRRVAAKRQDWLALAELFRARADAIDDAQEKAVLYFDLGRLCEKRLADPSRASLAFEAALRHDPTHVPALDALAELAYRQHDWERAKTLYWRLDPDLSTHGRDVVLNRRGELADVLGHEDEADSAYRQAIQVNPSNLPALEAIARLSLYRGEAREAIAALRKLLELLPKDDVDRVTAARQQLGELCNAVGESTAARTYFELVLAEDPTRISALAPLAELYLGSGHWQKGAEILGRLSYLVTSPEKRADLLFRMGEIYRLQLGDGERSAEAFLKAIDLDPRHVPTLRRLIDYYWETGDDSSLSELAGELEARGELVNPETNTRTLSRVGVSAALSQDRVRAARVAAAMGGAGAGDLAATLAEAAVRKNGGPSHDALARAARILCTPPGPSLEAVCTVLTARGHNDSHALAIAAKLGAS